MTWIRERWRWFAALVLLFLGAALIANVFASSYDTELATAVTLLALAGLLVTRRV